MRGGERGRSKSRGTGEGRKRGEKGVKQLQRVHWLIQNSKDVFKHETIPVPFTDQ